MRNLILRLRQIEGPKDYLDQWLEKRLSPSAYAFNHLSGTDELDDWIKERPELVYLSASGLSLPLPKLKNAKLLPFQLLEHPFYALYQFYQVSRRSKSSDVYTALAQNTSLAGFVEVCRHMGFPSDTLLFGGMGLVFSNGEIEAHQLLNNIERYGVTITASQGLSRLKSMLEKDGVRNEVAAVLTEDAVHHFTDRVSHAVKMVRGELGETRGAIVENAFSHQFALYQAAIDRYELAEVKASWGVHQFWHDEPPADVKELMDEWREMNPEYDYTLYSRDSALSFMDENFDENVAQAFRAIRIPAMQSDVFRVALIYKLGGIYLDGCMKPNAPISEWGIDPQRLTVLEREKGWLVNGFISAPANHPAIAFLWQRIEQNIVNRQEDNIWSLTGPGKLMQSLKDWGGEYDIISHMQTYKTLSRLQNFSHKSAVHWSIIQELIPLYKDSDEPLKKVFKPFSERLSKLNIYLHIGQHKTDSTVVQSEICAANLPGEYLYPESGRKNSGHHSWADQMAGGDVNLFLSLVRSMLQEAESKGCQNIILSSEYFSSKNEIDYNRDRMLSIWMKLSSILSFAKSSTVIYYVQDQVDSIDSRIRQAIRSRLCLSDVNVDKFLKDPTLNYSAFDAAMNEIFSSSEVIPRVFKPEFLKNRCVVSDFGDQIGLKLKQKRKFNSAFASFETIEKCIEINKMDLSVDEKMKRKSDIQKSSKTTTERKLLINDGQVDKIKKHFEVSNAEFIRRNSLPEGCFQ